MVTFIIPDLTRDLAPAAMEQFEITFLKTDGNAELFDPSNPLNRSPHRPAESGSHRSAGTAHRTT